MRAFVKDENNGGDDREGTVDKQQHCKLRDVGESKHAGQDTQAECKCRPEFAPKWLPKSPVRRKVDNTLEWVPVEAKTFSRGIQNGLYSYVQVRSAPGGITDEDPCLAKVLLAAGKEVLRPFVIAGRSIFLRNFSRLSLHSVDDTSALGHIEKENSCTRIRQYYVFNRRNSPSDAFCDAGAFAGEIEKSVAVACKELSRD